MMANSFKSNGFVGLYESHDERSADSLSAMTEVPHLGALSSRLPFTRTGCPRSDFHDCFLINSRNLAKSGFESCGPGDASGWYWTQKIGFFLCRKPSTV